MPISVRPDQIDRRELQADQRLSALPTTWSMRWSGVMMKTGGWSNAATSR
jgi:hypothetical protein